ncbi:MAG: dienelactone hydrolase family protein, partial [Longicatena sp.]
MKKISKILLALVLSIFMGIQGLNIQIKGAAGPIRPTTYGFIAQGGDEGYNDLITKAGMEKLTYTANETTLNYWAHIPKNKDGSAVKNLPVVLYMHGYSDGGNSTAPIQYHNAILYSLIKNQEKSDRQAIILVPQTPETLQQSPTNYLNAQWVDIAGPKDDQGWSKWNNKTFDMSTKARTANLNAVLSLLNKVQQENSADLDRTYVTGMSMGGYATWDLISRDDANIFAAAVPICGVGDPTKVENMKNVPIRTFHGGSDTTISPESTRLMYHNLRKYGNISYTEYPNENHGSWESAYSNTLDDNHNGKVNIDDLIEWMFNQSRKGTLDKKVDKEPLAQIVRDAKNEEEENHTLDDWKSLQAEIVKAEALIASESATYEQTKASAKVLDELINKI